MENVILGLLLFRPLTAYDINGAFKEGISMFYKASYGSIQTALKKLLSKNLITFKEAIENGRNKKSYSICEEGSKYFYQWMNSPITNRNNESIVSAKVYFLGLIKDNKNKILIIEDIVTIYRDIQSQLQNIKDETSKIEIDEEYREIFKFQMKSLEHGLAENEASIKFYTNLINELA